MSAHLPAADRFPGTRLSVVIPAYNEAERIVENLRGVDAYLRAAGLDYEIIVSDDGSTDATLALVQGLQCDLPRLRVLQNPHRGKGPTVAAGVLSAEMDYILFADADMATPIADVAKLLPALQRGDCQIAIASREGIGAHRIGEPRLRHLMGRVFNHVIQWIVPLPGLADTQCGFKAFTRDAAMHLFARLHVYSDVAAFKVPYTGAFDVEVLYIGKLSGFTIRSVPITWTYFPTTRVSPLRDSLKMLRDVIRIRRAAMAGKYA